MLGDVSDEEAAILALPKSNVIPVVLPSNTVNVTLGNPISNGSLVSFDSSRTSCEFLKQGCISNIVLLTAGDAEREIELVARQYDLLTTGTMLAIVGSASAVDKITSVLVDGSNIKIWTSRVFGAVAQSGSAESVAVISINNPTHLHNFLKPHVPIEIKNVVQNRQLQSAEPQDLRFVHRSDVNRISEAVISLSSERQVSVRPPLFLEGGLQLERLWKEQFGQTVRETYYPGGYDCPALEAYRFSDLRAVGTGPLITKSNLLFESSLQVMDRDQMAWWSRVHQADILYSSNGSQKSSRAAAIEYEVDEPALLLINPGMPMHYHFLFDFLSRLVFRTGDLKDVAVAAPNTIKRYQIDALHRFYGIPEDKLIIYPVDKGSTLFRNAIVTPSLVSDYWAMPEAALGARTALPFATAPRDPRYRDAKRLYVSRRDEFDTRRLVNEDEVKMRLEALGFLEVFPGDFSYDEEMYLFKNAEVIVGPFGSGMANVVFASPGTKIAFLHPDSTNWRILSFIMEPLDLQYGYIFGDAFRRSERGHNTEWVIDADVVVRLVSGML